MISVCVFPSIIFCNVTGIIFLHYFQGMEEQRYHLALQIQGVSNHLDLRKALRVEVCNMLILSSTSQLCQLDYVFQAIWGKYKLIVDPCGRLTEVKYGCRVDDHNQEKISVYQFQRAMSSSCDGQKLYIDFRERLCFSQKCTLQENLEYQLVKRVQLYAASLGWFFMY